MDEHTAYQDQLIDTALDERPIAPLPPAFVERVMARVHEAPAATARPPVAFRLELLDIAVPLLLACLVVLGLTLAGQLAVLGISTPLDWPVMLQAARWSFPPWLDLFVVILFAELCFTALFCVWLWLDRPLSLANGET
jgi:hypothetical protein